MLHQLVDRFVENCMSDGAPFEVPTTDCLQERRRLTRDPLFKRAAQEERTAESLGMKLRIDEPWKASALWLGERVSLRALADGGMVNDRGPESRFATSYLLALIADHAVPFLWRPEVTQVALAAPLPEHTVAEDTLLRPAMFFAFQDTEVGLADQGHAVTSCLIAEGDGGFFATSRVITPGNERTNWETVFVTFRKPWDGRPETGVLLRLCAFLRSEFVDVAPEALPRSQRRERARLGYAEHRPRVVKLRRLARSQPGTGNAREVRWKHQWWVGGHYRAQWYPSLGAHKLKYIAPYLKGPADAPMVEKVYEVAR